MVVLKPVVWSPNGYKFPAGIDKRGKDYVATSGFGGEEWNGDPGRIWNQQRVFYTNVKGKMEDYAQTGGLGIIMTAYSDNGPCAVGVATSVRFNTDKERTSIARSFNLVGQARAMWELESIQKRFANFNDFSMFWKTHANSSIPWRCPINEYAHFDNPVSLNPAELFPPVIKGGKPPEIVKMFSTYMAIRPDQALAIVQSSLDKESAIIAWLKSGTFAGVAKKTKSYGSPRSASPAKTPYIRYLQSQELTVTPRHHELQRRFINYIEANGASEIKADHGAIDVQFKLNGRGHVLAEVKPCDLADGRYAIRTAIGQLLDYKQRHSVKKLHLLVVLETKPSDMDGKLALENGFGLSYPHGRQFKIIWPT